MSAVSQRWCLVKSVIVPCCMKISLRKSSKNHTASIYSRAGKVSGLHGGNYRFTNYWAECRGLLSCLPPIWLSLYRAMVYKIRPSLLEQWSRDILMRHIVNSPPAQIWQSNTQYEQISVCNMVLQCLHCVQRNPTSKLRLHYRDLQILHLFVFCVHIAANCTKRRTYHVKIPFEILPSILAMLTRKLSNPSTVRTQWVGRNIMGFLCRWDGLHGTKIHNPIHNAIYKWDFS